MMKKRSIIMTAALFLFLPLAFAGALDAAEFYLVAKAFRMAMPDGTNVTMWGYAEDADSDLGTDGGEAASSPGPVLTVPPGDSSLTIHLRNDLPVPTSIVIPGTTRALSPVFFTDDQGRRRVRSFAQETPAGSTGTYTWTDLEPGTYLYESGTHVAVQVQMGLYGALRKPAGDLEAYDGISYENEVVLLYSEVDPALHEAVAQGTYGTRAYPSTIDYTPRYFLINGVTYPETEAGTILDHALTRGETILVRFLNAGLETHVPTLIGGYFSVVAEDGNPYPYPKEKYDVFLPAGKTKDVLWRPERAGAFPLYDKRLRLTNRSASPGGMLTVLHVE